MMFVNIISISISNYSRKNEVVLSGYFGLILVRRL